MWKKSLKQLPATFNARAESVTDKPMFRDAFKRHRCIIPASGYYEWIAKPDGKQPYFNSAASGSVLNFAGLWDRWKNPEGEPVTSCTIIVTDANAMTRPIRDRMPVILDNANFGPWLNGEAGKEFLKRADEDRLRMWPVSRRINKTGSGDDDPTLIDEVLRARPPDLSRLARHLPVERLGEHRGQSHTGHCVAPTALLRCCGTARGRLTRSRTGTGIT